VRDNSSGLFTPADDTTRASNYRVTASFGSVDTIPEPVSASLLGLGLSCLLLRGSRSLLLRESSLS